MTPDRCPSCVYLTAPCCACGAIIVEATGEWSADFARHVAELKAREPEIIRAMLGDTADAEAPSSSRVLALLHAAACRDNLFTLTTLEPSR